MLFRITVVTMEGMTIDRDSLEEARKYRDELQKELRGKAHHGEVINVHVGSVTSALRDGTTNGVPDDQLADKES